MLRERFLSLAENDDDVEQPLLVDIGTSSLTAVRKVARPDLKVGSFVAHPVMETLALSAGECAALGSDFARTGFLFQAKTNLSDTFIDSFGIQWLRVDGSSTPVRHPLETASLARIVKYPRPTWPQYVQLPEAKPKDRIVVADAPCPGLLDLSFGLRSCWTCLDDMTSNWQKTSALLDWSLEAIVSAYEHMLAGMPFTPDVLVYGDDLGFQQSMFVSEIDFRNFIRPRMRTLFSRLRRLTSAKLCFHSCGAIRPIIPDLCDLGIDLINFDGNARDMICSELRREIPRRIIFHGCTDLCALGRAVRGGDMASVALLTTEIVDSMPAIAAPMDNMYAAQDVEDVQLAACFLHELSPEDIDSMARLGPVHSILDNAVSKARRANLPELYGKQPRSRRIAPGPSTGRRASMRERPTEQAAT